MSVGNGVLDVPPTPACPVPALSPCEDFISELSGGSLLSPERSATVLFQCELLMYEAMDVALRGFRLRGPGIARSHVFFASSDEWYRAREARNDEFPCGIDFILFDRCGNVVCVPRTTKVEAFDPCLAHIEDDVSCATKAETSATSLLVKELAASGDRR
jgi:alpha-D-ribose 1-methylphosphonate 5-triphosphate synthase subunit PhnH